MRKSTNQKIQNTFRKKKTNSLLAFLFFLMLSLVLIARPHRSSDSRPEASSTSKIVKHEGSNTFKWDIVSSRTNISFKVKHFVLMEVEGRFNLAKGVVETTDLENFSNAKLVAEIPVASLSTGNEDRDIHLKTNDFFNVEKYPTMKFKSTKVTKMLNGGYELLGMLTIREISKPIKLMVEQINSKTNSKGNLISKFTATGSLNRYDYGLTWNELTETGSMVVGKDVQIELNVTLEKSPN